MTEYTNGHNSANNIRRKLKKIIRRNKIMKEQLITYQEYLNQRLQVNFSDLRDTPVRSEQYHQNRTFKEDAKKFYRELGKKNIWIEKPPGLQETKEF